MVAVLNALWGIDDIIQRDQRSLQLGQSIRYRHGPSQSSSSGRRLSTSRDIPGDTASGVFQTLSTSRRAVGSSTRRAQLSMEVSRLLREFKKLLANRLRLGPRNQIGQEQRKQLPFLLRYILNLWLRSPESSVRIIPLNEVSDRLNTILRSLVFLCRYEEETEQFLFHSSLDRILLNSMIAVNQIKIQHYGLPEGNHLTLITDILVVRRYHTSILIFIVNFF